MDIYVNDEKVQVDEGTNITTILDQSGIKETTGLAVAVNSEVISRTKWKTYQLNSNDKIVVIRATQGG